MMMKKKDDNVLILRHFPATMPVQESFVCFWWDPDAFSTLVGYTDIPLSHGGFENFGTFGLVDTSRM